MAERTKLPIDAAGPTTFVGRDFPQLNPDIYIRQGEKGLAMLEATPNVWESIFETKVKELRLIKARSDDALARVV